MKELPEKTVFTGLPGILHPELSTEWIKPVYIINHILIRFFKDKSDKGEGL